MLKKKGITLVSLVITIIIILILAGVGISGSLALIEEAKYTAHINDIKQKTEAMQIYLLEKQLEVAQTEEEIDLYEEFTQITKLDDIPKNLQAEINYIRALLEAENEENKEEIIESLPISYAGDDLEIDEQGKYVYYLPDELSGGKHKAYIYDEKSASVYKVDPTIIWGVEMHGYEYGDLLVTQPGLLEKAKGEAGVENPPQEPEETDFTLQVTKTQATTITINAQITDNESGIKEYRYYVNGETKGTTTETTYTITGLTSSTQYSIYVIAVDEAGNEKTSTTVTVTTALGVADLIGTVVSQNTYTQDKYGNEIVIPKDFKIVSNGTSYVEYKYDKQNNVSTNIPVVQDGIVIEHVADENQFVWVPVGVIKNDAVENTTNTTTIQLGRYATFTMGTNNTPPNPTQLAANWSTATAIQGSYDYYEYDKSNTTYANTKAYNLQAWLETAQANGGYYIARYEASYWINEDNSTKALSKPSTGTPSPKGGSAPTTKGQLWNFITQPNAAIASRAMYPNQAVTNAEYYSDLVNSYAWDTAIIFIQIYSENTTYASQNSKNTSLANTGERGETDTDRVCNIYDMASNQNEWTTETWTYGNNHCVFRGGSVDQSSYRTNLRYGNTTNNNYYFMSFRPLLYVRGEQ